MDPRGKIEINGPIIPIVIQIIRNDNQIPNDPQTEIIPISFNRVQEARENKGF
jgi:hypothetical protein